MPSYQFADLAAGRVTSGGTTAPTSGSSESWTVAAVTGTFPTLTAGQVFDVVDPAVPSELMTVTATASSTAWTVTRGAYGTTPLAHLSGFQVRNVVTAAGINAIGNGTFVPAVPSTGSFTYDGNGNPLTDPDGNTYTWNADGTPHTQSKGGVTRTFNWNTDGTLASVA